MKENFRSTKPITEFALNVVYRLKPPEMNPDHKELVSRGLIERTQRNGADWWTVRFNQTDGPKPSFHQFANLDRQFDAIAEYCRKLIEDDGVQPCDICLIYNGSNIKYRLETQVAPMLSSLGVELSIQTNRPFSRSPNMLLATTSHSFKGYDAEVVIIPGADQYVAQEVGILANNIYVAMTRARSILTIFAQTMSRTHARQLYEVFEDCLNSLHEQPQVESEISPHSEVVDILDIIGQEHRKWLMDLWGRHRIFQEPLMVKDGEVVAQPLFWVKVGSTTFACFGREFPRQRVLQRLDDFGVKILAPGQTLALDEPKQ